MAEVFRILMKLLYLSVAMFIHALFNLFTFFRTKNTPGNDYIFLSALCSIITLPMLFGSYPLSIVTWIGGLVLYFIGAIKNHEANDDTTPLFYLFTLTIAAFITFALFLLHL